MLGFLRRHCSNGLPHATQRTLYISLVRSHLTYASLVWAPSQLGSLYLMRQLEGVQRRATRYILYGLELDYKRRLIRLNLLPLSYFLEYLDLLFLFRCFKGEIHLDISDTIVFSRFQTRRGSTGMDIRLIGTRTTTYRESYVVRICPLWNALPLDLRSVERTSLFKSRLKALYTTRLYSVFDPENIRSWRIICPICRRANVFNVCTC